MLLFFVKINKYMSVSLIDKSSHDRTQTMKVYSWFYEEPTYYSDNTGLDDDLVIYMSGLTPENETIMTKVVGFKPFVYLHLPERIKWNKAKCQILFDYFKKVLYNKPVEYEMLQKKILLYNEPIKTMFIKFRTSAAAKTFQKKAIKRHNIYGLGTFQPNELKVYEHNIDPIIKFCTVMNIQLANWVHLTETIPTDEVGLDISERKFSKCDIDMVCRWNNVIPYTPDAPPLMTPKYISFDGEMYSSNHNSTLPKKDKDDDVIFHISCAVGRENCPLEDMQLYLFTLFDPLDIKDLDLIDGKIKCNNNNIHTIKCDTEKELLLEWGEFVERENPDIFVGYNTMKFDWDYIIARADKLGIFKKFTSMISRLYNRRIKVGVCKWSSSAYKTQQFNFLDVHGTNVDIMVEVERNYKLPKYSLNVVSEFFLKEKKKDVTAAELFMLYYITKHYLNDAKQNKKFTQPQLDKFKSDVRDIMVLRKTHAETRKYRKELLLATTSTDMLKLIRRAMNITGTYAFKDVILPVRLMKKLQLWTSMEEMTNCMHVPMSYLHTRGQQIKVLAQVYRETFQNGVVIPPNNKDNNMAFQGAIVIDAFPGDYDNVACLDFASLYPSEIIAHNISHDTLVRDDDPISDSECHVLDWEEHRFCKHDTAIRKTKKSKKDIVLCCHHRYRFKKMKMLPDGSRINEGLLPKLLRNLLSTRKKIKWEMFKLEAKMSMQRGEATEEDIISYKKKGIEIIEAGTLSKEQEQMLGVEISVLDSRQLAIKVSANSCYGSLGAKTGFIPFLQGAASVTAMGRFSIIEAIRYIRENYEKAELVYGDTDSAMFRYKDASREEAFELAEQSSKMTSVHLRCKLIGFDMNKKINDKYIYDLTDSDLNDLTDEDKVWYHTYKNTPITFEFENMSGRFLLLSKKRYVTHLINKDGIVYATKKKGVVLARRDNCKYLRDTYENISDGILNREVKRNVILKLYDNIQKLFTCQVPTSNLTIYLGINDVFSYIEKEVIQRNDQTITLYKQLNGNMIDEGVLHDLVAFDYKNTLLNMKFTNLPQSLMALKKIERDDVVQASTKFEYVYVEKEGATHVGEQCEDYSYYLENMDFFRIDRCMYLEKKLEKPITELFNVKYPPILIPYEKHEDKFKRLIDDYSIQNELITDALSKKRTLKSKINYIIECSKKTGPERLDKTHELVNQAYLMKSVEILKQLYKQHNLPSRRQNVPSMQILKGYNVMLMRQIKNKIGKYDRFSMGTIIEVVEIPELSKPNKKVKKYRIIMDSDKLGTESIDVNLQKTFWVEREDITPVYHKDSKMFKQIIKYRVFYRKVVDEINNIFSPFYISDQ